MFRMKDFSLPSLMEAHKASWSNQGCLQWWRLGVRLCEFGVFYLFPREFLCFDPFHINEKYTLNNPLTALGFNNFSQKLKCLAPNSRDCTFSLLSDFRREVDT